MSIERNPTLFIDTFAAGPSIIPPQIPRGIMNPDTAMPSRDIVASTVEQVVLSRRSALAFSDRPADDAVLRRLFEAARWSASSNNEQPWKFLVVKRGAGPAFETLFSTLAPGNAWAEKASVLVLTAARRDYATRAVPNRHAGYDLGQAVATLTLLASSLGLGTHQMGGFDAVRARELFAIPPEFELYSVIAIGHPGAIEDLPDPLLTRARATRKRRELSEQVWLGAWETPAGWAAVGPLN
jgi:nitroreductase